MIIPLPFEIEVDTGPLKLTNKVALTVDRPTCSVLYTFVLSIESQNEVY